MFLNKRGTFINLKNMILILLAFVFIYLILTPILKESSRGADTAACRNWAVIESSAKVPLVDIKLTNLNSPCVTFKDELKGNEFEVHETIAKGMYDVWKMYGQGKLDFFSDWNWFNKETYCFIGDEITSDEDREINIDKFEEYLSDNNPPQNEQTYAEFFTSAKNTRLDFGFDNINLKENEKIYILFTVTKGFKSSIVKEGVIAGGSCILGAKYLGGLGAIIGGVLGLGAGSIPGAVVGGAVGCVIVMVPTGIIHFSAQADELHPGLILISGTDISSLEKKCDGGLYYNPKQKIKV